MVRAVLVVVALALVLPSLPALGVDDADSRESLKDLSGVYVLMEGFPDGGKRAGFDRRTFQTDMELKFRMAGIKVLSKEERSATPGNPYLYVAVSTLAKDPGGIDPYWIRLEFNQDVRLSRDASVFLPAATWAVSGTGNGDVQDARNSAKDLVDQFINAWLSVNPKE